jgi:23S rRNA (adenine2503-C2)-methyltransferase
MNILSETAGGDAVKYLVGLEDGNTVEALYMRDRERRLTYHSTACVSSQVGCAVGCRFCATGAQGLVRNLDAGEIAGQARLLDSRREVAGHPPLDAVVFAGMGEPLFNFEGVTRAITLLRDGLRLEAFELATAGVVPKIRALAGFVRERNINLRLNVSLHAATDEKRARLIPLTRTYGVAEVLGAAGDFALATGTKARVRYMLLKGFNDSDEDIARLIALLRGKPVKLVISQYNDNNIIGLLPPDPLEVLNFYNKIKEDADCDIFHNFGAAVLGGCGQLRQTGKLTREAG